MKKALKLFTAATPLSVTVISSTGCFGEFALTRKVYSFNDNIAGNDMGGKVVKNIVYYAMNIIPVYGVAGFVDFFLLNTIEFWTGSNPVAMKEGEVEYRVVNYSGSKYQITATKNQFEITPLEGVNKGKETVLNYDENLKVWTMTNDEVSSKIIDFNSNKISYTSPKGVVMKSLKEVN